MGWKLLILKQASFNNKTSNITPFVFIMTITCVTLTGILLGLLGSWMILKFTKQKPGEQIISEVEQTNVMFAASLKRRYKSQPEEREI